MPVVTLRTWLAPACTTSALLAAACGGSTSNVGPPPDAGGDGPVDAPADFSLDEPRLDSSTGDSSATDSTAEVGPDSGIVDTGAKDVVEEPDAPFVEAPHTLPVIPSAGGPTIAHPLLVTITYSRSEEH